MGITNNEMYEYCSEIIQTLDHEISELTIELDNSILMFETAINLILRRMSEIKGLVLQRGFTNELEEISFFKILKPSIVSKLIYYNAVYKIEVKKPYGNKQVIEQYINNEMDKLKRFYDNNLDFYKYYRSNSSYLDHKYFIRGKHEIKLGLDAYYFEADHSFSTSHDFKVAKIIANDLIQVYLENQLKHADKFNVINDLNPKLQWTGTKASLIELIYALHTQGVFGNAEIKEVTHHFERMFRIYLGEFYHTYLELRNRKINRTKFLDALRDGLIRRMDEWENGCK